VISLTILFSKANPKRWLIVAFLNYLGVMWTENIERVFRGNRPFATNGHMVQNPPYWRASSLLFPHWDIKTKRP